MSTLSWGKPKLYKAASVSGAPSGTWTEIDTPKEDTTKLTPTAGTEKTATEEGGEIVDRIRNKNSFKLEFDIFVKKGKTAPFDDTDGLVDGEWAIRVVPQDDECQGIQIDKANVSVEMNYSSADGILLHYVVDVLKPAAGKMVKPYTAGGLVIDKTLLYFAAGADTTGKAVTATSTGNVTAATSSESWCTVSHSGKVTTVKVTENTGSEAREATVTIVADGKTAYVKVVQIPA